MSRQKREKKELYMHFFSSTTWGIFLDNKWGREREKKDRLDNEWGWHKILYILKGEREKKVTFFWFTSDENILIYKNTKMLENIWNIQSDFYLNRNEFFVF